jgi:ABC-type Fe3+/spermidine/putrescine transport system ATPase subunit
VRLADGTEVRARTNGAQGAISIGVRPEKISLTDGGANRLAGQVKESAYIGVATEVIVSTAVGELTVFHQNVEAGGVAPPPGSAVTVSWTPEATFVVERDPRGEETLE